MRAKHSQPLSLIVRGTFILLTVLLTINTPIHAQTQATDTPVERLTYGDSVTCDFDATIGAYLFSFYADQADTVTITMIAKNAGKPGAIDPALVLIGTTGQTVAQNDDSLDAKFGLTNARLINFPILQTGLYQIRATRDPQTTPAGTFTLTLKGQRSGSDRANLTFETAAQGQISSDTPTITYEFRAAVGDLLSADVQRAAGGALSPSVTLLNPADQPIAPNSAAPTAHLAHVLIDKDGIYTLVVSGTGTTSGAFSITLRRELNAIYMAYGDSQDGTIDSDTPMIAYIFAGQANDVVTIKDTRQKITLTPRLVLLNTANRTLITANGAANGSAQITRFRLPTTGAYIIQATRTGSSTGDFTVTLTKSP